MAYRSAKEVLAGPMGLLPRALILTIVPEESRAVYAHLEGRETVVSAKDNLYEIGRYAEPAGDWLVIVATCQPGNCEAATIVQRAHSDFERLFHAQIVVGVAGSLKDDVLIGSVVVAERAYQAHAGKEADQGFQGRPHSHPVNPVLLEAARKAITDGDWVNLIRSPEKFPLPKPADYPAACAYPPTAYLKAIASTEVVLASENGTLYQQIKHGLSDAAAVDMEGYGALNAALGENTPALIVRGISDMCEGKIGTKDAQLQPIAAAHAAAMAMQILTIRSLSGVRGRPAVGSGSPESDGPLTTGLPQVDRPLSGKRLSLVVTFDGTPADFTSDKLTEIKAAVASLTGDATIEITDIRPGSARIIVDIDEATAAKLSAGELHDALTGELKDAFRGIGPLSQLDDATVAVGSFADASRELVAWDRHLPDGQWIERPELGELLALIRAGESSTTALLGEPGSGKSALLSKFAAILQEDGVPTLAIKADALPNTVETDTDLQHALKLDLLAADALAASAMLGPVVLVIDQLDALASQLDLKTGRLNVLLNLVRRMSGMDNVHIILSARTFEYNHDVRLKAINAEAKTLQLPPWTVVAEALKTNGIDAENWPQSARDTIRTPQALKTFLLVREKTANDQPFLTYQAMLEQLWKTWVLDQSHGAELSALASSMAATMAENETLWLALARFDDQQSAIDNLEALNILVRSEDRLSVGFSHQTVFEHVLARTFVGQKNSLCQYVADRQQSLFIRGKLWSALVYLRGAEPASYEYELAALWHAGLRPHLKFLLIEFLGSQAAPTDFEEALFVPTLSDPQFRLIALNAVMDSPGWFDRLLGFIQGLMTGSKEDAWLAYRLVLHTWQMAPTKVLPSVEESWAKSEAYDEQLWALLESARGWRPELGVMASTIIGRTSIGAMRVDNLATSVAVEDPEAAMTLVLAGLNYQLEKVRQKAPAPPPPEDATNEHQQAWLLRNSPGDAYESILADSDWSGLPDLATHAPIQYLTIVWPFYRTVFEALAAVAPANAVGFSPGWGITFDYGDGGATSPVGERFALAALRTAVELTAERDPVAFLAWVNANSDVPYAPLQSLMAHAMALQPEEYCLFGLDWLLADSRRLCLGDMHQHWRATRALITAMLPHWTDEQVTRLDAAVREYAPAYPDHLLTAHDRWNFAHQTRALRVFLLRLIPEERRSLEAQALVQTDKSALTGQLDRGVTFSGVQTIGSPMSTEAMMKAKDADILNAFNEVPDSTDWDHPSRWMKGGNIQLSRAFAEFSKRAPERAIALIRQFKPHEQERAAGYALDALAELGADSDTLQELIVELGQRGFASDEFIHSAARAAERISDQKSLVSEAVIAQLETWLDELMLPPASPKNDDEEFAARSRKEHEGSLLWGYGGISILPAGAYPILAALTAILLNQGHQGRDRAMMIFEKHLSRNQDPRTWQAILRRLSHAGGSRPEPASQFLRRLFATIPTLPESHDALHLLAHVQWWDNQLVEEVILPWRTAESEYLRQSFGELIGLIALVNVDAAWAPELLQQLLQSTEEDARVGLAYAAANLFSEPQHRTAATRVLVEITEHATKAEIVAVLDVFRVIGRTVPDIPTLRLMRALAESPADMRVARGTFMVNAMQQLLPHAAQSIGTLAKRLVDAWAAELADFTTGMATTAPELADLALTLHRLGGQSRSLGIEIFERLIEINAYGARDTMIEIDGRFDRPKFVPRRRIVRQPRNARPRRGAGS